MDNSVKTGPDLNTLATQLRSLETGTFEIRDYIEANDLMSLGCSSGDLCSCSCILG